MNRQMTLAEINDEFDVVRTNSRENLKKMDSIISWVALMKIVELYYYKRERGIRHYDYLQADKTDNLYKDYQFEIEFDSYYKRFLK